MKSILQEASSIERAIDKAWNEAGKPKEFTIKVLDQGERNFFGLTRRPAIVSILYKPEKSTYHAPKKREDRRSSRRNAERPSSRRTESSSSRSRSDDTRRGRAPHDRDMGEWREEWRQHVNNSIRQITKNMGIKTPFQLSAGDDKVLTVTFKHSLLQDEEEQRMLFASLSYLSIQFLKREYKNRFAGFRIVVTGPAPSKSARTEQKAEQPKEARDEKAASKKAAEQSRGSRRSSDDKPSRGGAKRGPSKKKDGSTRSTNGVDDAHVDEQLRFARQQLEQEEELADVFERAVASKSEPKAEAKEHAAPVGQAGEDVAEKTAAPEKTEAPAQDKPAESPTRQVKPLKEGVKYQPFFVMPDEKDKA